MGNFSSLRKRESERGGNVQLMKETERNGFTFIFLSTSMCCHHLLHPSLPLNSHLYFSCPPLDSALHTLVHSSSSSPLFFLLLSAGIDKPHVHPKVGNMSISERFCDERVVIVLEFGSRYILIQHEFCLFLALKAASQ